MKASVLATVFAQAGEFSAITLLGTLVLIFLILIIFFWFIPVRLWIAALASGAHVGLFTLVAMRLRRVPPKSIVEPRITAPEAPAMDANGVPLAWSLQVATVSSAAKAEALRQQLLAMQEKAYIRKVERGDRDLYRVFVGPKFERAQLERLQARVDARFGVQSLIVRYLP